MDQQFWARSYWVSSVGRDEVAVPRYFKSEKEDQRLDQMTIMPL